MGRSLSGVKQELTYREIDESDENLWSVLYATGYLTGRQVGQANADLFQLWIPNGEIRKLFADLVEEWFQETARADSARINRFCAAFPAGDVTAIQEMLHDYLWDSHQCAGHGGTEEPEGKLLPWDAAGPAQKPGEIGW